MPEMLLACKAKDRSNGGNLRSDLNSVSLNSVFHQCGCTVAMPPNASSSRQPTNRGKYKKIPSLAKEIQPIMP